MISCECGKIFATPLLKREHKKHCQGATAQARSCALPECDEPATKSFTRCRGVCIKEHQQPHWRQHQASCGKQGDLKRPPSSSTNQSIAAAASAPGHWMRHTHCTGWDTALRTSAGEPVKSFNRLLDLCELVYKYTIDTQWVGAKDIARCPLEQIASDIFSFHTEQMASFDEANSGAEWWVQVRDHQFRSNDNRAGIHWHWDMDTKLQVPSASGSLLSSVFDPHISATLYSLLSAILCFL